MSKNRHIKYPMLPGKLASKLNNSALIRIPPKQNGEYRILSADIGLMASSKHKNDASSIFINQMRPTKMGRYINNIVYAESYEGLRTEDQALVIRELFDEFDCDYIALDTNGLGLGIYDCLSKGSYDPDSGVVYPPLSCCNDDAMASRCVSRDAEKVIWSIKATSQFNSDCAYSLRNAFRSNRIRLLVTEYDAEDVLGEIKSYNSMSAEDKLKVQMPYINTTLLINELIKLKHEDKGGKLRLYERAGMRKDRYSSLLYNYYVSTQIENKMNRRRVNTSNKNKEVYIIRPPRYY